MRSFGYFFRKARMLAAFNRSIKTAAQRIRSRPAGVRAVALISGISCGSVAFSSVMSEKKATSTEGVMTKIANWSNTHNVTGMLYQPESIEELDLLIRECHNRGLKLRPVGAGISPNGIAFSDAGMVNLSKMNSLISVDPDTLQVRVQAGMRVSELVDALEPYGLTLLNYASVKEQEIGGFVQAGAHGTGALIPPLDDTVVAMKLVTPGRGILEISRSKQPQLLDAVKVGLGAFGVVAEVTLQCTKRHNLEEHTFTVTRKEVVRNHKSWLNQNKHIRYMWIPYTDTVVVVTNNPTSKPPGVIGKPVTEEEEASRLSPLRTLLLDCIESIGPKTREKLGLDPDLVESLNFAECRDWLLKFKTLDSNHVRKVNRAEAEFWKNSEGRVVGDSSEMLQFECGGEQLVLEVCFPTGTLSNLTPPVQRKERKIEANTQDVAFVVDLLDKIEEKNFPAPAPIEQRWSRASQSRMSPAASPSIKDVFSWVGVIMYLPVSDPSTRKDISDCFKEYGGYVREVGGKMPSDVYPHWGKIEMPKDEKALRVDQQWLAKRYPVQLFNDLRRELDPKNILANDLINSAFPRQ